MLKISLLIVASILGHVSVSTSAIAAPKDMIEIGILEERCTSESEEKSGEEGFHTGVRPVFYWADNRWNSYQNAFAIGSKNGWKTTSSEFARRRQWHFTHNDDKRVLVSEADVELPRTLWFAAQPIVAGEDVVPQTERSHAYVWWNGVPVRPQIAVSSQKNIPMTRALPGATEVSGDNIPASVLISGYEYLQKVLGSSWPCTTPHEDCRGYNLEVESVFEKATRYVLGKESLTLYDFHEAKHLNYQPMSVAPMICVDQVSGERWHLRDGLKFIAGGDFTMDGKWEYVFWIDAYNENGYLLVSEMFRQVTSYTWTYH